MCNKQMRQSFKTASGIPFSNYELLVSNTYSGTGRLYPSCTVVRYSKDLFPASYKVQIDREGPVIVNDEAMLAEINAARLAQVQKGRREAGLPKEIDESDPREHAFKYSPLMSREEHYATYTTYRQKTNHSPYAFPFTMGAGGFIFVDNEKRQEKIIGGRTNDPPQFVFKRAGQFNPDVWSNPSGLASGSFFTDMAKHIVRETGIVILDEDTKTAIVVAPSFMVSGKEYAFLAKDLNAIDGKALKAQQMPHIRAELDRKGYEDYSIRVETFTAHLLTDKLPPRDLLTLVLPVENGSVESRLRAFVVKDGFGSLNINLPFRLTLLGHEKILCIDCQGQGREAALKTQDELMGLEMAARANGKTALTRDLFDLVERPSRMSYIPKAVPKEAAPIAATAQWGTKTAAPG